jgi:uncharacterized protein with GYD domain
MPSYVCQIDVDEQEYQNSQEFVSVWGDIRSDVERLGGEITDTYAILGDYDFHVIFTVDDEDTAFQVTQSIERHGLDTKTMQAVPLERLGELVGDY